MIDALRSFLAVAAAGSFSQVAKSQSVAVSSVTRKVEGLEAELGTRLFHRSSRRVSLTDAGEQFLPRARNILAELSEAKDALAALHADPRGVLSVTATSIFGRRILMPAVTRFLARYPLMAVDLHISDHVVDLAEQRLDVAIRIGTMTQGDLLATRLAPLRLVACASPAYLARRGTPLSSSELVHHDCIVNATNLPNGPTWRFDDAAGPIAVKGSLRTDDKDCMREAAVAGQGVAHLGTWLVAEDIAAGRLVRLFPGVESPEPRGPARGIHAARMPGRSHDARARLFIEHLREEFGEPTWWDRMVDVPPTAAASPARAACRPRSTSVV